jgi:hypothetical protein
MNTFGTKYHQYNNGLEIVLSHPRKPPTQEEIIKRTPRDKEDGHGYTNYPNYGNPQEDDSKILSNKNTALNSTEIGHLMLKTT